MNNLKMFVSKIADRGRADSANASRDDDSIDPTDVANSVEGFICPVCHLDLSSMETLQQHFESAHAEPSAGPPDDVKEENSTRSELDELKTTVRLLQDQLEAERTHSNSVKEAMDDLKQTFLSKDGKEMDLVAEYKAELTELRAKSESSISKVSALTVELTHARSEVEAKQRDNEELRNSLQSRDELVSSLEKRLAEAEMTARERNSEVSRLQETVTSLQKSEAAANERIEALTKTIEETRSAWESESVAAEQLVADKDAMRSKVDEANEQISELKSSMASVAGENQRLIAQLESQKQAVLALKKQLASAASPPSSEDQEPLATESDLASQFKTILEIDRVDDYTSFACHVEALQKISSDAVRACRKLDDQFSAGTPDERTTSEWILKMLRMEDSIDGQDLASVGKSVLLTGNVPEKLLASTSISQVDSFLGNLGIEDSKKEEVRRALIAGILIMQSAIIADSKAFGADGLPGCDVDKSSLIASQTNEVRKLCFALIDNSVEALKSVLEASNARIDGEIQKSFQANSEKQSISKELSHVRTELEMQLNAIQSYQKEINEKSKLFEACQNELASKSDAVKKLETSLREKEESLTLCQNELASTSETVRQLESALEEERLSIAACRNDLASKSDAVKALEHVLQEKEESLATVKTALAAEEAEIQRLNDALVSVKEVAAAEKASLRSSLEEAERDSKKLEDQLKEARHTNESLDQNMIEVRQTLTAAFEESQAALEAEKQKGAELEERGKHAIAAAVKEVSAFMDAVGCSIEQKEREIAQMLDPCDGYVERLSFAFSKLKSATNSYRKAIQSKTREVELVRVELAEEKEAQQEMKQMFIEEKMALESQLEEKSRHVAQLEERIDDLQASHAAALGDLNELCNSTRKKLEIERNELEDTKGQLMERDRLLKTMRNQRDEMAAEKNGEISRLTTQLDEASGKRLELEAMLNSENEEKRAILDRFGSMEGEVVSLRAANAELHRKVNDVEAGLHELARENQALQVELAKTQNRKWMDDTVVEGCQACEKGFSLTIRKHHCRQCGKIYCHECSSKTATLPSFKKPARVCDKCYSELYP